LVFALTCLREAVGKSASQKATTFEGYRAEEPPQQKARNTSSDDHLSVESVFTPRVSGLAMAGLGSGLAPLVMGRPDEPGVRFQVQTRMDGGGWSDFEEGQQQILRAAILGGETSAFFSARGYDYEVSFTDWKQRNLQTGKERRIQTIPDLSLHSLQQPLMQA
ncbi:unnamed protein product, partial [Polarella glacialis]